MPIYEFECGGCGRQFEKLCRLGAADVQCPDCNAADVRRLISTFYSASGGSSDFSTSSSASCGGCRKTSCAGCR